MGEKNNEEEIGHLLRQIMYRWSRIMWSEHMKSGLGEDVLAYGRILGFIERNKDREIFQKDIEKEMGLSKSAVSNMVTAMEKNGHVARISVASDGRLRQVVLTDKGREVNDITRGAFERADYNFTKGVTKKQQEDLIRILSIINGNMKKMEDKKKE